MKTPQQLVLESTARVVAGARFVAIDRRAVEALAEELLPNVGWLSAPPERYERHTHLFAGDEEHAQWLLVADALNFSFWADSGVERWSRTQAGEGARRLTGALALADALYEAQAAGVPVTDASYLEQLGAADLTSLAGGVGVLPMLEERRRVLNELGRVLNRKYGGQVSNLLARAGGSAAAILELLINDFPSFRDVTPFEGGEVYFLKRAQIFVSDLWQVFGGEGVGQVEDALMLTAFADYKLPQLFRSAGVLIYHESLARSIDALADIPHGSREEVELRAATVQAVEALRRALEKLAGTFVITCKLDNCLWELSQREEFASVAPHHRTRTLHY